MKKILKISLIVFVVLLLGVGGWWSYNKYFADKISRKALTLIPENAVFIVETNNLTKAWTQISNSKVWNFLIKNPYFSEMNEDIEMLNTYLRENQIANILLNNRELLVSAHMVSGNNWDFIFVADMEEEASMLEGGLKQALGLVDGYKVTERKYKNLKIIELADVENPNSIIYLSVSDNLLVVSFTSSLIENAINQKDDNHWENNKYFKDVTDNLGKKKLFRFFFNYQKLDKFSGIFLNEKLEAIEMLNNSLSFSAFNINLEDELLSFLGYTGVDSTGSYIKALAGVKPGKMQAWKIMSDQTALYFSMNFNNYMNFYDNLRKQYKIGNTEDMEDIEKNVARVEKYLGIKLQKHFFDWIGSEISFVKLRPGKGDRQEDVVVTIHSKDIDNAKIGLKHILNKIKQRTPLKFEKEIYKNFEINMLERRDFFKLFFGKLFNDLEKPYFTFIEDFVVMSNSLETLKIIIDDYITGSTLQRQEAFIDFKDNFSAKSNINIFIRTPKIYQNLYYYSSPEDRKSIKENKDFILSFARIGFQLVSKDEMFETSFIAAHDIDAVNSDKLEKFEKEILQGSFREKVDSLKFKIQIPFGELSEDKNYIEYYENTKKIKYEGNIKNEKINGIWKSYYESGNLKSSVNYEDGKVSGESFFFFDNYKKIKKAEVTFIDETVANKYFEYYENGAQKSSIEYKNGKAHGEAQFYFPNGKLKISAKFKNGLNHGKWLYYNEKGKKIGKEKWRNGVKKK